MEGRRHPNRERCPRSGRALGLERLGAADRAPREGRVGGAGKDGRSCSRIRAETGSTGAKRAKDAAAAEKGHPARVVRWSGRQGCSVGRGGGKRRRSRFLAAVGPSCANGAECGSQNIAALGAPERRQAHEHARTPLPVLQAARCAGWRQATTTMPLFPAADFAGQQKSPPWYIQRGLFHGRSRKRRYPFAAARAPEPLRGRASPETVCY